MEHRDSVSYSAEYRGKLLNALEMMDLPLVSRAIEVFEEARTLRRRIFVCGDGANAMLASSFLCNLVKNAHCNLSSRFRILALSDQNLKPRSGASDLRNERVFADQLRNFAQSGDVVMGISPAGSALSLVSAFEYASSAGCRVIALTGPYSGKLVSLPDVHIQVPASHSAGVEDGVLIVCHMIGNYFLQVETA